MSEFQKKKNTGPIKSKGKNEIRKIEGYLDGTETNSLWKSEKNFNIHINLTKLSTNSKFKGGKKTSLFKFISLQLKM